MKKTDNRKKRLTPELLAECQKLKSIFDSKKKELKISQATIADAMGINQSSVSHYLNGVNALNKEAAIIFAKILRINVSDFSVRLSKEIEKTVQLFDLSGGELSSNNLNFNNTLKSSDQLAEPFSYSIIAWNEIEEFIDKRLSSNKDTGALMSSENVKNGFWVEVTGDSMWCSSPSSRITFPNGTMILVDPNITQIESNKFYIIKMPDGAITFKQLIRDAGISYLKSLNDNFKPVPIKESECKFLGLVVDKDSGKLY